MSSDGLMAVDFLGLGSKDKMMGKGILSNVDSKLWMRRVCKVNEEMEKRILCQSAAGE